MSFRFFAVRLSAAAMVAALSFPSLASAQAVLSVTPSSINVQAAAGTIVPSRTVEISKWTIGTPTASWLRVSPTSGINRGVVTVSFPSAFAAGTYTVSFQVTAQGASPVTVPVQLTITSPTPTLTGIAIVGASSVTTGQTSQYTLRATYSNGTIQSLTTGPAWSTSNTSLATITQAGVLTGVAAGSVTVRASYSGLNAQLAVTVGTAPTVTLTGVSIVGATTVTAGQTSQYTLRATYSNGTTQSLTTGPAWSTTNTGVATITQGGLLSAVAAGSVTVRGTYSGLTGQLAVTVAAQSVAPVGTVVYVSPTGVDANGGTQTSPVRTIQRGVALANQINLAGSDATVSIAAGTYREAVTILNIGTTRRLVLQGAGSTTVLTGTDNWSAGWTAQADGSYVRSWPYKWGMRALPTGWGTYWNADGNGYKRDILRRAEMVYVNGRPLTGVLSLAALTAGTFYVEESTSRMFMRLPTGVTLAGALVEVGLRPTPLRVDGRSNVTLQNFAVERTSGAITDTAVMITNASNIVLQNFAVRWAAYSGLGTSFVTGLQVRLSVFSDNGVMAVGAYRDRNIVFEDNEIARNNWRGWPAEHKGWDANHKWLELRDAVARRIRVIDNWGNGFYLDSDNQRVTLENSLISGNRNAGLTMEMNQGPLTIRNNRICNNGFSGVSDVQSNNVSLIGNHVFNNGSVGQYNILFTGNYNGRYVTDYLTGATTLIRSQYWTVTDNIFAGSGTGGWLWVHSDYNSPGAWAIVRNSLRAFDRNQWYHSGRANAFWLPFGQVGYSAFRSDLQLANNTFEVNSTFQQTAPALSCTLP
jgi:hypothetical protein